MKDDWIPHLRDLCFTKNGFDVDPAFAEGFVKLHEDDWLLAQDHWERAVQRILNTDAVGVNVSGKRAIEQAVCAAGLVLVRTLQGRCPFCTRAPQGDLPIEEAPE